MLITFPDPVPDDFIGFGVSISTDGEHYDFVAEDVAGSGLQVIHRMDASGLLIDPPCTTPIGPGEFIEAETRAIVSSLYNGIEVFYLADDDAGVLYRVYTGCEPIPILDFRRGDADADGVVNALPDGIFLLQYQFLPGSPEPPCFDAADVDDNGIVNEAHRRTRAPELPVLAGEPATPGPGAGPVRGRSDERRAVVFRVGVPVNREG